MSDEDNFFKDNSPPKSSKTPWLLLFLVLALAGGIGYFGFQQLESERQGSAAARKAADEASAKLTAESEGKKALEAKLEGMAEESARLASERDILSQEVKEKDSELSKLKATYDSLQTKLQAEIKKGDIRLSQVGGRLQVDLVDKILFDSGQSELNARGQEVLSRVGSILATVEDKQIQVSGHTDDSPIADKLKDTFPTNWELSVSRAVHVVRFLTESAKVPSKRLVAAGYGEFHPIATNANPTGRARNRRIEILLTPSLDAKPADLATKGPAKPAAPVKPPLKTPAKSPAKR
jgi:chemotaxis protein MotB